MSTHVKVREKGHDCRTHVMHSDARKGLRMDALITACQLHNIKLMLNTLCTYCKFWLKFDSFNVNYRVIVSLGDFLPNFFFSPGKNKFP